MGSSVALVSNITATAALTVATTSHSITETDVVMACDSTSAAIAQVTTIVGTSLFHISTGTTSPGNCSQGLGYPVNCTSATGAVKTFQPGGFVAPLTSVVWYVGVNSRGGSSLFRAARGTGVSVNREEIAEGVTDMQIEYLLRDEATGNLDASWVGASSVTGWTPSTPKQVVAVRVTLDLESLGKVGTDQATLKRQQIFVVNLRNRVI
jgi:type IV pilus assembly protein PilW